MSVMFWLLLFDMIEQFDSRFEIKQHTKESNSNNRNIWYQIRLVRSMRSDYSNCLRVNFYSALLWSFFVRDFQMSSHRKQRLFGWHSIVFLEVNFEKALEQILPKFWIWKLALLTKLSNFIIVYCSKMKFQYHSENSAPLGYFSSLVRVLKKSDL